MPDTIAASVEGDPGARGRCRPSGDHCRVTTTTSVSSALVSLAALLAGCAGPSAAAAPSPVLSSGGVPAGCEPAVTGIQWSGITREPVLESVFLFTGEVPDAGRQVLDEPVIAAVGGAAVPDAWLLVLAAGLGKEIGANVETVRPVPSETGRSGTWVIHDPGIPETVAYEGVRRVSATFAVGCTPAVTGALTAWTETTFGTVSCGTPAPPADGFEEAALRYCPRTPHG